MTDPTFVAPNLAFLLLAVLAGVVAFLAAARAGLPRPIPLNLGALAFLGQFGTFVVLAGLGVPSTAALGAALALGVAVGWAAG